MDLKFYLNKFLKVDQVEEYTLSSLMILRGKYEEFLEKSEGIDPDFPTFTFGGKAKGVKVRGVNPFFEDHDSITNDDFSGNSGDILEL